MQDNQSADPAKSVDDPYARTAEFFQEPPQGLSATLRQLGPGMILVGSIVGSGELIMTTKLGAEAGFVLLWFVLLSCVIKVVVQAELARHTISSGKTFLEVFNGLPGPSGRRPVWLNLEWMAVVIVACVLALAAFTQLSVDAQPSDAQPSGDQPVDAQPVDAQPIDAQPSDKVSGAVAGTMLNLGLMVFVVIVGVMWARFIQFRLSRVDGPASGAGEPDERPQLNWFIWLWMVTVVIMFVNGGAILGAAGQSVALAFPNVFERTTPWGILVACAAAAVLLSGSYRTLERISVGLVATFTVITIICTFLLQWTGYAITPADVQQGLTMDIPVPLTAAMIMTALGMYAGTGIGTSEMSSYTYWCVEKGYARHAGAEQPGDAWPRRALGWIRVMYTDVFLTMIVYTISTVCFYFLGAAILNATGQNPDGPATLSVLEAIYTESLGSWAATLFVVGAFFVLFSTVLAGVAGGTRTLADGLCVMRIIDPRDYPARLRFTRIFVVVALSLHALTYSMFENPPFMLMIASLVAVALYPVLGLGTIYLRYREVDSRILPGRLTTCWLWVCGIALAAISPAAALYALALEYGWLGAGGG